MTTSTPPTLCDSPDTDARSAESPRYLREQLITSIGNKRALLPLIHDGVRAVQDRLGRRRLRILDAFAGSGVVSRFFKQFATLLVSNDLESYARVAAECYLSNASSVPLDALHDAHRAILSELDTRPVRNGIIRRLYAPRDDNDIRAGERVFYTTDNAQRIDSLRFLIGQLPATQQRFFLAPLLSEASVHANTSGVFKGFYKDARGIGQFGGHGRNALTRILGAIELPFPLFSRFECEVRVHQEDANRLVRRPTQFDLAYFDPPYNQHPYGSNYFMLNLILENREPARVSRVSGIPTDWNRSLYNKSRHALDQLRDLIEHTRASHILISYNSEGFIPPSTMDRMLRRFGRLETIARRYNTFRGSRNLRNRSAHVTEHLFLLERS